MSASSSGAERSPVPVSDANAPPLVVPIDPRIPATSAGSTAGRGFGPDTKATSGDAQSPIATRSSAAGCPSSPPPLPPPSLLQPAARIASAKIDRVLPIRVMYSG